MMMLMNDNDDDADADDNDDDVDVDGAKAEESARLPRCRDHLPAVSQSLTDYPPLITSIPDDHDDDDDNNEVDDDDDWWRSNLVRRFRRKAIQVVLNALSRIF